MTTAESTSLRRSLGFWALVLYGVGDILGAGIYALVGKIAGVAGTSSWLAFSVALGAAALTALSYAELGSRFPKSGGESHFCHRAFRSPSLALLIGWLVFCSGVVSMAAVSHAFSGYLLGSFPGSHPVAKYAIVAVYLTVLAGINLWGIRQSSAANIICTLIEFSGLLLVIVVGVLFLANDSPAAPSAAAAIDDAGESWWVIASAAGLAFFAFIGFEDMVNVAEEVKSPQRNLPAAILTALVIAGSVYIVVVYIATAVVPPQVLAENDAPLLEVVHRAAKFPAWLFTVIALFAVANTGLLNCIMGSRLLYGMAEQRLLPAALGQVNSRTRTPHWAIVATLVAAITLAWSGTLLYLAGTTSVLLLIVFATVNVALVVIKRREPPPANVFQVPMTIPVLGGLSSLVLVTFLPQVSLIAAAGIVVTGVLLVLIWRLRNSASRDAA